MTMDLQTTYTELFLCQNVEELSKQAKLVLKCLRFKKSLDFICCSLSCLLESSWYIAVDTTDMDPGNLHFSNKIYKLYRIVCNCNKLYF